MPAPEIIHTLVQHFEENRAAYRSGRYNEAQLRLEFLNPFFEALGWDVANKRGYAPANREVITEDSLEIEGNAKAPDYCFRLGHTRKFFVEAKKPQVDIKYDIHPAYQLRRYAWNAHLPLSILTDFEEFAVYDSRGKPNPSDSAATARVLFFNYTDYIEQWDQIAAIFARDSVWKGSFDQYAAASKGKKGTTEVDDAFLKDIEEWRLALARNIALRNQCVVDERQLNFAVQMTIDRVIFLRICEDRAIEPENALLELTHAPAIYPSLVEHFRAADRKYNSGLFHFAQEKSQTSPADTFTPTLTIDDKVLKDIIKSLYYPCPYIFKEIPVEILGQVYEQFLGKVIRLTPGHQAKVEEKPEVRKAGGVYYTPKYIVDYIVANTLGKLLEGKTPAEAAKLKLVDPACGSGSFLLGAFQCLLDWHKDYYEAHDPESHARGKDPALCPAEGGGWKLTTAEKKRILTNTIHGVDIDPQAVEVTKLSLLLKVLEEESGQLSLGFERALPDLARNIQCGNSLIGEDYFEGRLVVDQDERRRVNPFEWHAAFPHVFAQGGFDAVIGNPPYIRPHNIPDEIKKILWAQYSTFVAKSDLYSCFMEKGLSLINPHGVFSFIVPITWTSLESFTKIRILLVENSNIIKLTQLPKKVFEDSIVETCIFVISKHIDISKSLNRISVENIDSLGKIHAVREFGQSDIQKSFKYNFQLFSHSDVNSIYEKLKTISKPLSNFVKLVYGFKTADDSTFLTKNKKYPESRLFIRSKNVKRYKIEKPYEYVWYVPSQMVQKNKTARPGEEARFLSQKLIVARMGKSLSASYDSGGLFVKDAMLLLPINENIAIKYILGILNSKLINYLYTNYFITIDVLKNALLSLPIALINESDNYQYKKYQEIIILVDRMMTLNSQIMITPGDMDQINREIAATDRRIDQLVYQLYGLTEEEIKIVEGN